MAIFNSYEAVSLDLDLYAFVNKIPVHIATMRVPGDRSVASEFNNGVILHIPN